LAIVVKLSRLLRMHQKELGWYEETLRQGYPGAQYHAMNLAALAQTVKFIESLIDQGFEDALVAKFFEDLGEEESQLPVKGEDFIRFMKASGEVVNAPDPVYWMNNPTPLLYRIEGQIHVKMSHWVNTVSPYHSVFIRLDDAEEGGRFTDYVNLEKPDRLDVAYLGIPEKMAEKFRKISHGDYLRLAGLVNGYAASVYRRTGYPIQMLSPLLLPGTLGVYFSSGAKTPATHMHLGYITPYDQRFGEVLSIYRERDGVVPDSRGRAAIVKIQTYGTKVGENLYRIESEEAFQALEELAGEYYPLLIKAAKLCGEGLYLWLWYEGERPRYRRILPPQDLFPTILAARSYSFFAKMLRKVWGEGPNHLLLLRKKSIRLGDRRAIIHIGTEPRKWSGEKIYLDIETGSGFALPVDYLDEK